MSWWAWCDEDASPLAVEVWPGDTADKNTVIDRVRSLKERFCIKEAVFVGDKGMYSAKNIDALLEAGFKYIFGLEWHEQLELFDEIGILEGKIMASVS